MLVLIFPVQIATMVLSSLIVTRMEVSGDANHIAFDDPVELNNARQRGVEIHRRNLHVQGSLGVIRTFRWRGLDSEQPCRAGLQGEARREAGLVRGGSPNVNVEVASGILDQGSLSHKKPRLNGSEQRWRICILDAPEAVLRYAPALEGVGEVRLSPRGWQC